jgi:hypothetical protein
MRPAADVTEVQRYGRELGQTLLGRALVAAKRSLEAGGDKVVAEARREAFKRFDTNSSDGLAAHGITRAFQAIARGAELILDVGWLRPYGVVLEYGPLVDEWDIFAKHRKALRFWDKGDKTGIGEIKYRKKVHHEDDPSHRRPHLVPAADRMHPRIAEDIGKLVGDALTGVRFGGV